MFIKRMIMESSHPKFSQNIGWFTSIVSKESNLKALHTLLERIQPAPVVKTISYGHGNKSGRILAWSYKFLK